MDLPDVILACPLYSLWGISLTLLSTKICLKMFFFYKIVNLGSWTIYGPKVITLILANFKLVKCCLLYYSQVNKYNQIKAGSLFYSRGKNYKWPVKTVPLREFFVRSLWRISHLIIQVLIIVQLSLFPTSFYFIHFY